MGKVEPLRAFKNPSMRKPVMDRILEEYPERTFAEGKILYHLRKKPNDPNDDSEHNSPPGGHLDCGRLDSIDLSVFYFSDDIDTCVHECRVTVEDELYLATLSPTTDLRFLV